MNIGCGPFLPACLPFTSCLIAWLHANRGECLLSGSLTPCYVMPDLIHCSEARVGIPSCTWKWAVGRREEGDREKRGREGGRAGGRAPCSTKRKMGGYYRWEQGQAEWRENDWNAFGLQMNRMWCKQKTGMPRNEWAQTLHSVVETWYLIHRLSGW